MSKEIFTRIIQKHDTESAWSSSTFVPDKGELIVYDPDKGKDATGQLSRIKIGDGVTLAKDLPFVTDKVILDVNEINAPSDHTPDVYRLTKGVFLQSGMKMYDSDCIVRDTAPSNSETGECFIRISSEGDVSFAGYYVTTDKQVWCYLDTDKMTSDLNNSDLSDSDKSLIRTVILLLKTLNISTKWRTIEDVSKITSSIGGSASLLSWGGVVTSIEQIITEADSNKTYLYIYEDMYSYKNGAWVSSEDVVCPGAKPGAEVFNSVYNNAGGIASHAEGYSTTATGLAAHSEGTGTEATGDGSHSEGVETHALSNGAHAEGEKTHANNKWSHAEGYDTYADGQDAHAEGSLTHATGAHAHAEGYETFAEAPAAHSEGKGTRAKSDFSHAEGMNTTADAVAAHAEGTSTSASGAHSHAEGYKTQTEGSASHAGGLGTIAAGDYQTAIGRYNAIDDSSAFIIGNGGSDGTNTIRTNALSVDWSGNAKFSGDITSKGRKVLTTSDYITAGRKDGTTAGEVSTAEGILTTASGVGSHSEGGETQATGPWSHSEGYGSMAIGNSSHASGVNTIALGDYSHVEGDATAKPEITENTNASVFYNYNPGAISVAAGKSSHSEGRSIAAGSYSHAEGMSQANGAYAHSEGELTKATGVGSHAGGYKTTASGAYQTVIGKLNKQDNNMAFIVGGGYTLTEGPTAGVDVPANLASIDWLGNAEFKGTIKSGSYGVLTTQDLNRLNVASPQASNETATEFISDVAQENGRLIAAKKKLPEASITVKGIVKLSDSIVQDSTTAATSSAMKEVYDTVCSTHHITTGQRATKEDGTETSCGRNATAEGYNTDACGNYSHAEGHSTTASGSGAHAEGYKTEAGGFVKNAEGDDVFFGEYSHAEGHESKALAYSAHAEGYSTQAGAVELDSEGGVTFTNGIVSVLGQFSHSEGRYTTAVGMASHAEGYSTNKLQYDNRDDKSAILDQWSDTKFSLASGDCSHVEGRDCLALDENSHAEGHFTVAQGAESHAEGHSTTAEGECSHAEGYLTHAEAPYSHAEGYDCVSEGECSHAQGKSCVAHGDNSFATGWGTSAYAMHQTAIGRHNIPDVMEQYAFIIGNGSFAEPSNALTVKWTGDVDVAGDVISHGTNLNKLIASLTAQLALANATITNLSARVETLEGKIN